MCLMVFQVPLSNRSLYLCSKTHLKVISQHGRQKYSKSMSMQVFMLAWWVGRFGCPNAGHLGPMLLSPRTMALKFCHFFVAKPGAGKVNSIWDAQHFVGILAWKLLVTVLQNVFILLAAGMPLVFIQEGVTRNCLSILLQLVWNNLWSGNEVKLHTKKQWFMTFFLVLLPLFMKISLFDHD